MTKLGSDGRASPGLADRWTWDNDGLALRLHLRPNVTFHNGTKLDGKTAADALERVVSSKFNQAQYPSMQDVVRVVPESSTSVLVTLSRRSPLLVEDLGTPLGIEGSRIGTGPFKLVSTKDSFFELERFDAFSLGRPPVERVTLQSFDNMRSLWSGLLRGDVDVVTNVSPDAVEFVKNESIDVITYSRRYQYVVAFNLRKAPFSSTQVRRALNLAIDRTALINRVLKGFGTPAVGPLWPQHWAYDTHEAHQPRLDRAAARALLNTSGFPLRARIDDEGPAARFQVTCIIPNDVNVERLALEVQRQLYEIGVDMQFETVPKEDFGRRLESGAFDAALLDLVSGPTIGRAYMFWRSATTFQGPFNVFGYENHEAERLFDALRTSPNDAVTRSVMARLQDVLVADPPALFLAWSERAQAVRGFETVVEPGRDPLADVWRWTPRGASADRSNP